MTFEQSFKRPQNMRSRTFVPESNHILVIYSVFYLQISIWIRWCLSEETRPDHKNHLKESPFDLKNLNHAHYSFRICDSFMANENLK